MGGLLVADAIELGGTGKGRRRRPVGFRGSQERDCPTRGPQGQQGGNAHGDDQRSICGARFGQHRLLAPPPQGIRAVKQDGLRPRNRVDCGLSGRNGGTFARYGLDRLAEPAAANAAGEGVVQLLDAMAVTAPQGDHPLLTLPRQGIQR